MRMLHSVRLSIAVAAAFLAGACASSTITDFPDMVVGGDHQGLPDVHSGFDSRGKDFQFNTDVPPGDGGGNDRPGEGDGGPGQDVPPGVDLGDGGATLDLGGSDVASDRRTSDVQLADMPVMTCVPLNDSTCPSNETCVNDANSATTGTCTAFGGRGELAQCDFSFSNGDCGRDLVCLQDSGANPPPPQCFAYCNPQNQADTCSQASFCIGTLVGVDANTLRFCAAIDNCDFFSPPAGCAQASTGRPCCAGGMRCEPLNVDSGGFVKSVCLTAGAGGRNAACLDDTDPTLPDPTKCQAGFLCISFGTLASCTTDANCTTAGEKCEGGQCARPASCQPVCDPTTAHRVNCPSGAGSCHAFPDLNNELGVCF
jgi:hypothetical protein